MDFVEGRVEMSDGSWKMNVLIPGKEGEKQEALLTVFDSLRFYRFPASPTQEEIVTFEKSRRMCDGPSSFLKRESLDIGADYLSWSGASHSSGELAKRRSWAKIVVFPGGNCETCW